VPVGEDFAARAAAVTADLDRLTRRLRTLSTRALNDRSPAVRAALDALAHLSAALAGRTAPSPTVADHVLADAIAVIGWDVVTLAVERTDLPALETADRIIQVALSATR
jgi:ABC-type transporter Mla subunit MlaD